MEGILKKRIHLSIQILAIIECTDELCLIDDDQMQDELLKDIHALKL